MSKSIIQQMIKEGKFTKEDVIEFAKFGYSQIEDGVLIKFDERDLDKNGNYRVPDEIKVIDRYAFSDVVANTIDLGSVEIIGEYGLWNNRIQKVIVPNTVKKIGKAAFHLSHEIETIELPEGLEEIPSNTFDNCYKLRRVKLPQSVRKIQSCAFARCGNLTRINKPSSLIHVGKWAFVHTPAYLKGRGQFVVEPIK